MQAIITKYLPATNTRGSRVKATAASGLSITIEWDYAIDIEENHTQAAKALCKKLGWTNELVSGGLKTGYAFVMLPKGSKVQS